MKVLVIGGTRGVGHEVVLAAHAAGHELTLLARNAERISLPVTGVRVVAGDAGDADDIERAVAGQHAVVWTVGVGPTRQPVDLFSRSTQFLLAAMAKHGVRRLICVTGVGAAVNIGDGAVVAVVAAQGGQPDRVCDGHDVSPDTPPCRDYGVGWRGLTIAPHGVVTRSLTVKVVDFACRGGGDFQHLVYGTIVGPVRRGFNGGTYRVWYQNDAEDLVRATGSRTVLDAARGARGQCVSESVE